MFIARLRGYSQDTIYRSAGNLRGIADEVEFADEAGCCYDFSIEGKSPSVWDEIMLFIEAS